MIRYACKKKDLNPPPHDKSILKIIFLILAIISIPATGFSQPGYLMSLRNGTLTSNNNFEFDVYIKSVSGEFELTSYQASLSLNEELLNGKTIVFSYITGTSDLTNKPSGSVGINNSDGSLKLTFASMPGSDKITVHEIRVGRFRIECSGDFKEADVRIGWCFSGNVNTIVTGSSFEDITVPANHFSEMNPTSADDEAVPENFELHQNFPNPFNPSTTISFNIPLQAHVSLVVFNILGEKVAQLADEILAAGRHEFIFNAGHLASGIYFYVIDVDKAFSDKRKMILLK